MGRDDGARRLVQLAAACGVAVLSSTENGGAAAMCWLLDACLGVEAGIAPGRNETNGIAGRKEVGR